MSEELSLLPPRSESERAQAVARAQARRNASTVKVFDPDSNTLVDVPASEEKAYAQAGYKVGPDAAFAMQEAGLLGGVATGALGLAKGATLGASQLLIPQSLRQIQQDTAQMHQVADIAGNVAGNLATLELGGAGGAKALAGLGAAKYAQLGAAASRIAMGGVQGGLEAEIDSDRNNSPLTAERFLQGVGMGMLINSAGEAGGAVLSKAVPAFQKGVGKFLKVAKNKGFLNRIGVEATGGLGDEAFSGGLHESVPSGDELSSLSDEARASFGGLSEPTAGATPPPLPSRKLPMPGAVDESIPFAKADLLETAKPGPTFSPETMDGLQASRPMSEGESRTAWNQLDKEASDASRMGAHEGMEGVADDLREQRDYYSKNRGASEDELGQWDSKRSALTAPDSEIDGAFDRAGFNGGGETVSGGLTDLPKPGEFAEPTGPERVGFKQRPPRIPTLNKLGKAEKAGAELAQDLPMPGEPTFQPVPAETEGPLKYGVKNDPGFLKETTNALTRTGAGAFGLMHLIPGVGPTLAKVYGGSQAAFLASRRALVGTLNREAQLNAVLDRVMAPAMKLTGSAVKMAIEGANPYVSQGYLGGDVDGEYGAIAKGAQTAASDPAMLEQYYQGRYGDMLAQNPELYGNIVAQSGKQHAYLASQVPKDPRENPGILEPDYDPPRSDKLKLIETYKAVNDPYSVLANPTADGIRHVQATHPETLQMVQKILLSKLMDPKVAKKLSPSQTSRLSIILQMPVTARDSDQFLGMVQQLAQANGTPPGGAQPGGQQGGGANGPVNLGGQQTGQFATQIAPPSQQQQLEDLR